MGASACLLLSCLLPQQPLPATASKDVFDQPEMVLVNPGTTPGISAFGLGDGGIDAARLDKLQVAAGECITPGGVRVRVQEQGVMIEFPNRGQLLFTPSGHLHRRLGGEAGPFGGGVALHFADGAELRIDRSGSRRKPLQEVVIIADGRRERLWDRQRPVSEPVRESGWNGVELLCGGDGDAVFRGIGLGPLLVLQRVLAPAVCRLPEVRLVLCTETLQQSLHDLAQRFDHVEPEVQSAVTRVGMMAQQCRRIFGAKAPPVRVDMRRLRYALAMGYDLSVTLGEGAEVRLGLHAGDARDPLVEWTLGYGCELHLIHPRLHEGGVGRYYRSGVRLPRTLEGYAARSELLELPAARTALERLQR